MKKGVVLIVMGIVVMVLFFGVPVFLLGFQLPPKGFADVDWLILSICGAIALLCGLIPYKIGRGMIRRSENAKKT